MELALETFRKPAKTAPSEAIGISKVVIDETAYRALEKLEKRLTVSEESELLVAAKDEPLAIKAPEAFDDLRNTRIRLFLDDSDAAHFHFTARRAEDNSLIYTEPAMIRLVAM